MVSAILIGVGIVHLIALKAVLGGDWITGLYGVDPLDSNLELLIRHRAVLFGLLGTLLVISAFQPKLQIAAIAAGLISTFSFIALSWQTGQPNELISKVILVDWVAVVLLVVAGAIRLTLPQTG
ncbi:MAG: hypothetical protein KAH34_11095 [Ketobacter sp.]|nr:hypothetical protein [Ketobacter sp.]